MSCQRIRDDLAVCVLRSDVYKAGNGDVKTCLKEHMDELPDECRFLRQALYDCKRGMLDMRKRFRGVDPGMNKHAPAAKLAAEDKLDV